MNRRGLLLAMLALVALTFASYSPALRNGFIWDDDDHFARNPAMTAPDGLRQIWSSLAVSRYYPLTLTTFWVERRLWGLNPMPYHAVNIALQAANAALLFLLLRRLNVRGAWFAAALWAIHPVNVESIAWCTELKNTQSGVFFFLCLIVWLRGWNALALVLFAAALLSKPSTVILPLIMLLIVWWQKGRVARRDLFRATPFFAFAAAISVLTIIEQRAAIGRGIPEWTLTLAERFLIAGTAIWFYVAKLIWPANLAFVYTRWEIDSFLWPLPLIGVIAVLVILWRRREREALFGVGFFMIAVLPVVGFFDLYFFRYAFVADHFQYLASIGILALIASAGTMIPNRILKNFILGGAVTLLGVMSFQRAVVFHDNEALWRDTLRNNPRAFLAHNNLGRILAEQQGRYMQAVDHFREALRLRPNFLEARGNLGLALIRLGKPEEATAQLEQVLRVKPDDAAAHMGLGRALEKVNRVDEAIGQYRLAAQYDPRSIEARVNLGVLLQRNGRLDDAVAVYQAALIIRPDDFPSHFNLANAFFAQTNLEAAAEHYRVALALASAQGHEELAPQIQAQLNALEQ